MILYFVMPIDHHDSRFKKLRYIWSFSGVISSREGVPRARQMIAILELYLYRQLGPLLYYEQQLWRNDFSKSDRMRSLTSEEFHERVGQLNPPNYQSLANHKLVEKALLSLFCLPTADYLGYLHPTEGIDFRGRRLTSLSQLELLLKELCPIRLCMKRAEGVQGRGFIAVPLELEDSKYVAHDVHSTSFARPLDDFLRYHVAPAIKDGLIIERYILQHPVLAAINPSSVNTLRIWVLQCGETVHVRGALLRMGRAGQVVDNTSQGGVLAPIDLSTGRVGRVKAGTLFPELLSHHPDTGAMVEGITVPFWEECIALAKATIRAIPKLRFSGLDIAITKSGPLVVETNPRPHRISARNFSAPMADLLDCE